MKLGLTQHSLSLFGGGVLSSWSTSLGPTEQDPHNISLGNTAFKCVLAKLSGPITHSFKSSFYSIPGKRIFSWDSAYHVPWLQRYYLRKHSGLWLDRTCGFWNPVSLRFSPLSLGVSLESFCAKGPWWQWPHKVLWLIISTDIPLVSKSCFL